MIRTLLPFALVAALAGCSDGDRASPSTPVDAPPATHAPAMPPDGAGAGMPEGDPGLAGFGGYGPLSFGTAAADMQRTWGAELVEAGKDMNDACYFMSPSWSTPPARFNFMVGDGKFVRFGTDSARFVAPGGGKVGMTRAQIAALYPEFQASPHVYVDGEYLQVADPAGSEALLIFETDAQGDAAKVTEWRVGLPPHAGYVEGCS